MCSENRKNHASIEEIDRRKSFVPSAQREMWYKTFPGTDKSAAPPGYPRAARLLYGMVAALTVLIAVGMVAAQPQTVAMAAATGFDLRYQQSDDEPVGGGRRLDDKYAGRAYPGAPPPMPHLVDEEDLNSEGCLQCHGEGSFVPRMQAYAPITPHPEQTACWQCHVAIRPPDADTTTEETHDPESGAPPPAIPHEVELTRNCLGCHSIPRRQAVENCPSMSCCRRRGRSLDLRYIELGAAARRAQTGPVARRTAGHSPRFANAYGLSSLPCRTGGCVGDSD